MPATRKRPIQDPDVPKAKRNKTSPRYQDVHNLQSLDTENDTTTSPVGKMIGANFRNFMAKIESKPTKKRFNKPITKHKGSNSQSPTRIKDIQLHTDTTLNLSINVPSSLPTPTMSPITSPQFSNQKSSVPPITAGHKCLYCWRRYPLKSLVLLHRLKAHKVHRSSPVQCSICCCAFKDNNGQGPWKDCCKDNIRKHFIQRSLKFIKYE